MSERWRIEPEYAMKVDPSLGLLGVLLEPTTVVTKAWEQVARGRPARVLGAAQRCSSPAPDRSVCWRRWSASSTGSRSTSSIASSRAPSRIWFVPWARHITPVRVADIGFEPDVIVECTGVGQVIADSVNVVAAGGIVCLTGVGTRRPDRRPLHRRHRGDDGAPEQRHRRQRQREQAALVQGRTGPGSRGPRVAGAPAHRGARQPEAFMNALAPPAGRHQGRHPVRRRVIGAE